MEAQFFGEFYGYTPYPQTIASKMNYLFIIQQPNDPLIKKKIQSINPHFNDTPQ